MKREMLEIRTLILSMSVLFSLGCQDVESVDESVPVQPAPEVYGQPEVGSVSPNEANCKSAGWEISYFKVGGIERKVISKKPVAASKGSILVLHGGGGTASDFCSGGPLVQPQIEFSNMALSQGFTVHVLDSTNNVVTDSQGRLCGKRFDFSVLNRSNVDLPYVEFIVNKIVPKDLSPSDGRSIFVTGLSTGGYMTIRSATHLGSTIAAFAPVSAGDPYGTDSVCDPSLSGRDSAVGILVDRETNLEITENNACENSGYYPNESPWAGQSEPNKPVVKQFQHRDDGIVDYSCFLKAGHLLTQQGYPVQSPFILPSTGAKDPFMHLWLRVYNQPILDFFSSNVID